PPYCYDYVGDTLITLFTEPKDYYRVSLLEGLNKYNQESDRKNCHQIDFTVGLFTKESKRILSAEAKRLSIILSSADDSSKKMIKKIEVPLMRLWLHEDEGVLTLLDDSRISGKIYQDESLVKAINSLRSDCLSFIRYTHK
ncbi:MAG: hypothetical protein NTX80_00075, partial [Candidatus Saccharibacteria bacterium]|nr:hypothetical protein [Candidatus Saccharibacteria bacterium]